VFTLSDQQRRDRGIIADAFRPQEILQPRLLRFERLDHAASSAHVMGMREGFIVRSLSCGAMGKSGLTFQITSVPTTLSDTVSIDIQAGTFGASCGWLGGC
jgi:hypothetical protein